MTSSLVLATLLTNVAANTNIDKNYILTEHNIARCMHGASPLVWDNNLASHAESWSDTTQYPGYHGGMDFSGKHCGQNLAGSCSSPSKPQADHSCIDQWMSEESANGGHYTQMMWKGSQKLGCGLWTGRHSNMNCGEVTCNYYPAGNVGGQYGRNVGKKVKSRSQCTSEVLAASNQTELESLHYYYYYYQIPPQSEIILTSNDTLTCTKPGSIPGGSCKNCLESAQCSSGYCCPYMKKCVSSGSQSCYYPIANCRPSCQTASCSSCHPTDGSKYPSGWAPATCGADSDDVMV